MLVFMLLFYCGDIMVFIMVMTFAHDTSLHTPILKKYELKLKIDSQNSYPYPLILIFLNLLIPSLDTQGGIKPFRNIFHLNETSLLLLLSIQKNL